MDYFDVRREFKTDCKSCSQKMDIRYRVPQEHEIENRNPNTNKNLRTVKQMI